MNFKAAKPQSTQITPSQMPRCAFRQGNQRPVNVFQLCLAGVFGVALLMQAGCAKKARSFTVQEAVSALEEQSEKVNTAKGRAWVNIDSGSDSAAFAGVLVIDRSNRRQPTLRLEALDPFGGTHHLLIVDEEGTLRWIDYDSRVYRIRRGQWHGVPIKLFPSLFLGVVPPSGFKDVGLGKVRISTEQIPEGGDSFEVEPQSLKPMTYVMSWINPNSSGKLGLHRLMGQVWMEHPNEYRPLAVEFSHFGDRDEFYLPGISRIKVDPGFEMKLSWRDREFNTPVDRQLFRVVSEKLNGFTKEEL